MIFLICKKITIAITYCFLCAYVVKKSSNHNITKISIHQFENISIFATSNIPIINGGLNYTEEAREQALRTSGNQHIKYARCQYLNPVWVIIIETQSKAFLRKTECVYLINFSTAALLKVSSTA
jgi:hypothetical protein